MPFCNDDAEPFGVVRACDQKTLDKVWEFMMGEGYFRTLDAKTGKLQWRAFVGKRRRHERPGQRQVVSRDCGGQRTVRLLAAEIYSSAVIRCATMSPVRWTSNMPAASY